MSFDVFRGVVPKASRLYDAKGGTLLTYEPFFEVAQSLSLAPASEVVQMRTRVASFAYRRGCKDRACCKIGMHCIAVNRSEIEHPFPKGFTIPFFQL